MWDKHIVCYSGITNTSVRKCVSNCLTYEQPACNKDDDEHVVCLFLITQIFVQYNKQVVRKLENYEHAYEQKCLWFPNNKRYVCNSETYKRFVRNDKLYSNYEQSVCKLKITNCFVRYRVCKFVVRKRVRHITNT